MSPPAVATDRRAPDEVALGFVDALRDAGAPVGLGDAIAFVDALARLGMHDRASVYWAGRATLVKRPDDIARYDIVFAGYWERDTVDVLAPDALIQPGALAGAPTPGRPDQPDRPGRPGRPGQPGQSGDERGHERGRDSDDVPDDVADAAAVVARASASEVLRGKDFAECTEDELAELHRLMSGLRLAGETRPSRRRRPVPRAHAGGRLDVRRSLRAAQRDGGELIRLRSTVPTERFRRLVLLCDISGSMEVYARALLRFAHVLSIAAAGDRRHPPVEVFTLGTRLTRVTRELVRRDPDEALARAAHAVDDWSGGTRLGVTLRSFNDEWGRRGIARGAVVVLVSDGWERDDPALLADEMARLRRTARRIVWVNPLKATPGYEPLARGMAAALPFVDQFVEGHSLDALEELASLLAGGPAAADPATPRQPAVPTVSVVSVVPAIPVALAVPEGVR